MNKIRQIKELNKRELEAGITPEGSWHADFRDTVRLAKSQLGRLSPRN